MEKSRFEEIKKLISDSLEIVEFGEFGDDEVSEDWIKKAENRLQVKFPPSYKWWIKTTLVVQFMAMRYTASIG